MALRYDTGVDALIVRDNGVGADRFTIKRNGNIGIGVTTPGKNLHISGSTGLQVQGNSGTHGNITLTAGNGTSWNLVSSNATSNLDFYHSTPGTVLSLSETDGAATFVGNVTVAGTLTAQEFHTEFVSASINYTSGSTKFGNSMDDEHQFTGSLQLSGSVGNESYIIGTNVGIGTTNPAAMLQIQPASGATDTEVLRLLNDTHQAYMSLYRGGSERGRISTSNNDLTLQSMSGGGVRIMDDGSNVGVYVLDGGNVGIGTTAPDSTLHVHTATGGSITPHTAADDLVVENDNHGGISILTPNDKSGVIYFGAPASNVEAQLNYDHANTCLLYTSPSPRD